MVIVAPDKLLSDIGFLTIAGGSRTNDAPGSASQADIKRALETGTAVGTLFMVPNQPLVFSDDNGIQRTEDSVIAYTWDKYLRTGDEKWPLRLPMTKAAKGVSKKEVHCRLCSVFLHFAKRMYSRVKSRLGTYSIRSLCQRTRFKLFL